MTLRRRLTLLAAGSVALAICLASVVVYVAVRSELRGQTDDGLRAQATVANERSAQIAAAPQPDSIPEELLVPPDGPSPAGAAGQIFLQRIDPNGDPASPIGPEELSAPIPIAGDETSIAAAGQGEQLTDAEINGEHFRVITVGIGAGGALQIARSLEGTDDVLSNLRIVLFLVIGGGIALAALLARRVADRIIAPITGLTEAAEHISETEDLSRRIDAGGADEVGRLAARFNAMLNTLEGSRAELAESVQSQRQLVADASHELRTPVASLRTDIEVLRANPELGEDERRRMLKSVDARIAELGALITDVIELARGDEIEGAVADVRLDLLAAEAVERMRGLAPGREFELSLSESVVDGEARSARAGGQQPDRQRGQVLARRPADRGLGQGRRAGRARSRPGDSRGRAGAGLRPLPPRSRGPRRARLGPRAGDREAGRRRPRRLRRRGQRAGRGRRLQSPVGCGLTSQPSPLQSRS